MRPLKALFIVTLLLATALGCKKDSPGEATGPLTLAGFAPLGTATAVSPGQPVRLTGSGFSATPAANVVLIGGQPAAVLGANNTSLIVNTPALPAGRYDVSVQVGEQTVTKPQALALVPYITNFAPRRGSRDTVLTVYGLAFDTLLSNNQVTVNGVPALLLSGTRTALNVVVPPLAGTGPITVTVNQQTGLSSGFFTYLASYQLLPYAGTHGVPGSTNGPVAMALFNGPSALARATDGTLYVADGANNLIRKISTNGIVSTVAGNTAGGYADGNATTALFTQPSGLALDGQGNIYVADLGNQLIRKITTSLAPNDPGYVSTLAGIAGNTTFADGARGVATFNNPIGVAVDAAGNVLVADQGNHLIRKITPDGTTSTVAGGQGQPAAMDGQGTTARFFSPSGLAIDGQGNLYVADKGNHLIRKMDANGLVSTVSGQSGIAGSINGSAQFNGNTLTSATYRLPRAVTLDTYGNIYVADEGNQLIRKIDAVSHTVSTIAGRAGVNGFIDPLSLQPVLNLPQGVAVDGQGNVYVADVLNQMIRVVTFK